MTHMEILDATRDRAGGYRVDVSRGERIGRVSSEWFSRPADERYLSLSDLYAAVHGRTERSCLELDLKSVSFATQAPGLNDSASAEAVRARHESWAKALPKESAALWDALQEWDGDSQAGLFAHIVSLSVNAVYEPWNRRPRAFAHADRFAQAVDCAYF